MKLMHSKILEDKHNILISPLNWGLGHASRCVPIIRQLLNSGVKVYIAGSGASASLLKQEFPNLEFIYLKSFTMKYSKSNSQIWAVLRSFPNLIYRTIVEHYQLKAIIKKYNIDLVISDNRFGLWNENLDTVFITHQLMVKMPKKIKWLEPLVWRLNGVFIKKFTKCWVPDFKDTDLALSGDLAHNVPLYNNVEFIGILSRFTANNNIEMQKGLCVAVLSGAEPQRTIWQNQLLKKLQNSKHTKVVLVEGLPNASYTTYDIGEIQVVPYLSADRLQDLLLQAEQIICRSGYSSIMDLYAINKLKYAELIPTPGQPEQEYLAEFIQKFLQ